MQPFEEPHCWLQQELKDKSQHDRQNDLTCSVKRGEGG
jgi:hypothetical protein